MGLHFRACRPTAALASPIARLSIAFVLAAAAFAPAVAPRIQAQSGRVFYVAPNGSASADGSINNPLSLPKALSSTSPARAGDTIYLRGGRYVGFFESDLRGTTAAPIIVRSYPGEHAVLDSNAPPYLASGLIVRGSDTWYWDFEVVDTSANRSKWRPTLIDVNGPRTKFINLVVHDGGQGFGAWTVAPDVEIYGSLIYNVGWDDPSTRGHGHSIYVQNSSGTKWIDDNILFNGFSFGIHAYTEGGAINNLKFRGNTAFNAGRLSPTSGVKANLLLGGGQVASGAEIVDNALYFSPGLGGRNLDLGYGTACSRPTVQNNYSGNGNPAMNLNCSNALVTGNTFFGNVAASLKSLYPNNVFHTTRPTTHTIVRPNKYEQGRGHVTIFNWDLSPEVSVNLSSILSPGDRYEVRDAQNYFGAPVRSGTYAGGSIGFPMTGLTAAAPIGNGSVRPPHTGPEFAVFIVQKAGGSTSTPLPVTATLAAAPASVTAGQSATLSWSTANATSVSISPSVGAVAASGSALVSPAQTTTYTLSATNSQGTVTRTATVTVTAAGGGTGGSTGGTSNVSFVTTDSSTKGNWKGKYGAQGYTLASDSAVLPAYAQVAVSGASTRLWAGSGSDVRFLQRAANTNRFVGVWESPTTFSVDVSVNDGARHRVAFYLIDWGTARKQTIEVLNPTTGAVLDTRTATGFHDGQYWVWSIAGSVRFRFSRVTGDTVAASAVFLDADGAAGGATGATNTPPTVSVAASPTSATAPASVALSATATDNGTVTQVAFYQGSTLLGTDTSAPFQYSWTNVAAGTYSVTARATDNLGATAQSSPVTVTIGAAGGSSSSGGGGATSAAFLATDTTTQGNWRGVYGTQGYSLVRDLTALPTWAAVTLSNARDPLWSGSGTQARFLQRATGTGRFAAAWESGTTFNVDVQLKDGAAHKVSLYLLDWGTARTQRVEVLNAATGAVLDSRIATSFNSGIYLTWRVTGNVRFRLTRMNGDTAAISGVFLNP